MKTVNKTIKVAVVQAAPVLFDKARSIDKACRLVREAGGRGSKVILLPESFIPAYPRGLSFGMVIGNRTAEGRLLWQRYWENSIEDSGPEVEALGEAAKDAGAYVAIGVTERESDYSRGSLYCSLFYFGPDGSFLGKHRKLKPTGAERLIWAEGDGSTLPVFQTPVGRIGGLICWENYMPLARMAIFGKGVEIYLAPTADQRETWQATMRHIACEGRCFVLGCNQFVTKDMYPADLADQPHMMCRGGSVIVSPFGEIIAGPLYDEEGILYADLDLAEVIRAKVDFDVVGHYARPDIFRLHVNSAPQPPITYGDNECSK